MRPTPGEDLVLTTDALVAGVHFFADDPPGAAGMAAAGGGDHTNRQGGSYHAGVVGTAHRTVRSFEGWNEGGCSVRSRPVWTHEEFSLFL